MEQYVGLVGSLCKRAVDGALALVVLAVMSPIMLMTALLIAITMGRPIFSSEQCIGSNGELFARLKFRTAMPADCTARNGSDTSEERPPFRISVGRMLSDSGLDGLPQLFNVLAGHMSFVGPRCRPASDAEYYSPSQHSATGPGLTSPCQVSR